MCASALAPVCDSPSTGAAAAASYGTPFRFMMCTRPRCLTPPSLPTSLGITHEIEVHHHVLGGSCECGCLRVSHEIENTTASKYEYFRQFQQTVLRLKTLYPP